MLIVAHVTHNHLAVVGVFSTELASTYVGALRQLDEESVEILYEEQRIWQLLGDT